MYNLTDFELQEYIKGDIPYLDLTTYLQNCNTKKARLQIYTREDILVSCTEEAARIAKLLDCEIESFIPSKVSINSGETILTLKGDYEKVHQAWRLVQILLEYSCKIATYARDMKKEIDSVNPNCELLATRKSFPFSKRFCIKSILNGGAMPHRLGLSETILFFDGHRIIYDSNLEFYKQINEFKLKVPEKKIIVESSTLDDAKELMKYGADVIQIDKADITLLEEIVSYKESFYPNIKILAAGGINIKNAKMYAATKIDGIVTSSIYISGMANLGSKITLIN